MLLASLIVAPLFTHATNETNVPKARLLESYVSAEPVERVAPKYPVSAAKRGQSGWVQMSFVVDEEGKVKDVAVLDHSGPNSFIGAAQEAVKKWQYSPAKVDGKAIEQCENTVQLDFVMGGEEFGKVSKRFNRLYKKGKRAVIDDDMDELKAILDKMDNLKGLAPAEMYWRYHLAIFLHEKSGDAKARYHALSRANSTIRSTYFAPEQKKQAKAYLLRELFIYQIQHSLFFKALKNFESLKKVSPESAQQLEKYAVKVKERLAGYDHIAVSGKISRYGNWRHTLARSSFALTNIQGNLGKLEVRCDKKRSVYTAVEGSQWKIPESWGQCTVLISGDENSTMTLVEINS